MSTTTVSRRTLSIWTPFDLASPLSRKLCVSLITLHGVHTPTDICAWQPELLSGTLRHNLDPFSQYDDTILNDALRAAGLRALQSLSSEGRITLDTSIADGGGNLSVGQRQIIALARAIVRGSKLLILDEGAIASSFPEATLMLPG